VDANDLATDLEGERFMAETTDTPILDLLADMTAGSVEASTLDAETLILVRVAALVAVDAPVASYLFNLGAASDLDIDVETVRGVLAAVAPIVGTPHVITALSKIALALDLELDLVGIDAEVEARS
jgi:alkylhydroperoxidase/carboxymuconolactone decarboxylase family protein YurZ